MSADLLREAAKMLRDVIGTPNDERDGWVIPGPWQVAGRGIGTFEIVPEMDESYDTIARTEYRNEALYIATMHPGVGLLVADLLDFTANEHDGDGPEGCWECVRWVPLARLILGREAPS